MEEPLFLLPVQRGVGGVQIKGDLRRRRTVGVEKEVDEQGLDRRPVIADLVIAGRLRPAQLQPVERRFAGQRRAIRTLGFQLAAQHRHHRVMAQLVVVDQILIAQREPEHALADQARHRVLDQIGRPMIGKATGKTLDQPDLPVGGAEQQRPAIRGHAAAGKRSHHSVPLNRCKAEPIRATLCLHRVPLASQTNRSRNTIFSNPRPRCTYPFEKSGLS